MRIFADGVFDFYHNGHREHFHRLKNLNEDVQLIVGVISDEECSTYKRNPTMNEYQRLKLVSKDKHVDQAMITPLIITEDFLNTHNIDYVYHAFANPKDEAKQDKCFAVPISLGIFRTIPYVHGVSSTEILSEWEHIWQKKGTVESNDLQLLNGYEGTNFDPEQAWEQMKSQMNIQPSDEILEVGCGAGFFAQHIENEYVGIDPSQSLILKHNAILKNPVCTGYAHNIPFADNSFDFVVIVGICQYFKDKQYTEASIAEWERVARKGIYIGSIRHRNQQKRPKHIYNGPTSHLIHTLADFKGFKSCETFYDEEYYFNCYKLMDR